MPHPFLNTLLAFIWPLFEVVANFIPIGQMKKLKHRKVVSGRTKIWTQAIWLQILGDAISGKYCMCEYRYFGQNKEPPVAHQECYIIT